MISARLTGDGQVALKTMGDAAQSGVGRAIAKLGDALKNNVQQNKLSGETLQVHSGLHRQGIAVRIEQSGTGINATVYSGVRYAAAQQFGFAGTVGVRASLRRIKVAFGRPIAAMTIGVGGYRRHMDLPQRLFLRSNLDDMTAEMGEGIEAALREAVR